MSRIDQAMELLVEYAGPMGKFVLKKQLKDLNKNEEDISNTELFDVLTRVVPDAIFDPEMQRRALREFKDMLN